MCFQSLLFHGKRLNTIQICEYIYFNYTIENDSPIIYQVYATLNVSNVFIILFEYQNIMKQHIVSRILGFKKNCD